MLLNSKFLKYMLPWWNEILATLCIGGKSLKKGIWRLSSIVKEIWTLPVGMNISFSLIRMSVNSLDDGLAKLVVHRAAVFSKTSWPCLPFLSFLVFVICFFSFSIVFFLIFSLLIKLIVVHKNEDFSTLLFLFFSEIDISF